MLSCAGKSRLFCLFLDIEDPVRKLHLVRTPPPQRILGHQTVLVAQSLLWGVVLHAESQIIDKVCVYSNPHKTAKFMEWKEGNFN